MNYELAQVPYDRLDETRPLWLPFIQQIAKRQRCHVEQRLADIYSGNVALVLVMDKVAGSPAALCGYSIVRRGNENIARLVYLTGEDAKSWQSLYGLLEQNFIHGGLAGIEAMARPGWSKFLKANGYRLAHVEYVKDF